MGIAIASDQPGIDELLKLAASAINGYCNSYMATVHYHHMLRTLAAGESWFAPQLLPQMLTLAQRGCMVKKPPPTLQQEMLTAREGEIAAAIAEGLSNKSIAKRLAITERTVKAHLSSVYAKLGLKDRLELARHLLAG
jgi:DNA-binding NarL/FixJ family response regulator